MVMEMNVMLMRIDGISKSDFHGIYWGCNGILMRDAFW